jgi:hypothetical protein
MVASGAADGGGRSWEWATLGALAVLTGWFLQTLGILAVVLVLLALLGTGGRASLLRRSTSVACGALATGALLLSPLLWSGAVGDMVRDAIFWPLKNYRKAGNVADVPLLSGLGDRLAAIPASPEAMGAPGRVVVALAGWGLHLLLLLGIGIMLAGSLWHIGRAVSGGLPNARPRTAASILTLVSLLLFWGVNPAWVALVYTMVPAAVVWCLSLKDDWHGRWRRLYGPALCLLLACGVLYHGRNYLHGPHALWEYCDVDRVDRESPLNRSLRALPFMSAGDTIAVLPSGGNTYLYTFPAAVGYTQLFVLELNHHTVGDHRRVAGEIASRRPKLVILHRPSEESFMAPDDPLSGVIRGGYGRWTATPAVALYVRKDVSGQVAPGGD